MAGKKFKIRLSRSLIGQKPKVKRTAWALKLRRIGQVVEQQDNATIRGMVRVVQHLIEVEKV